MKQSTARILGSFLVKSAKMGIKKSIIGTMPVPEELKKGN